MARPITSAKPKDDWLTAMRKAFGFLQPSVIGYDHSLDPLTGKSLPPIIPPVPTLISLPGGIMYELMPSDWVPGKNEKCTIVRLDDHTVQLWRKMS